jgi:hypothetical protein
VCAVLGAITIAFSGIFVRLSHASPSTAAIFRCWYALPVLGLIVIWEKQRFGRRSWADRRLAVAAGVFFSVDLILWNRSIADVGAGLSTVLANIQVPRSGDGRCLGQALERRLHVGLGELRVLQLAGQERVIRGQIEVTVSR